MISEIIVKARIQDEDSNLNVSEGGEGKGNAGGQKEIQDVQSRSRMLVVTLRRVPQPRFR